MIRESGNQSATLNLGEKTHPGMLPQFRALEATEADKLEGKRETVCGAKPSKSFKPAFNIPEGSGRKAASPGP